MPFKAYSTMSQRAEFCRLAHQEGANRNELCRRFAISGMTGYKWLERCEAEGLGGLQDRSRRPHYSPGRTAVEMEAHVLELREAHPCWGGRKLKRTFVNL